MTPFPRRGLYAITAHGPLAPGGIGRVVEQAILGGAAAIQYRDKGDDQALREDEATRLLAVCRRHRVPLIVNDDVALAARIGADGVHLGGDDTPLAEARAHLGTQAIIGVSCYNRPELALAAQSEGADYVAFGRFFPSLTKPGAVHAETDMLKAIRPGLRLPVVAIGGITPENGASLLNAGADLLAVIQGIFAASDPQKAASRYARLFS